MYGVRHGVCMVYDMAWIWCMYGVRYGVYIYSLWYGLDMAVCV